MTEEDPLFRATAAGARPRRTAALACLLVFAVSCGTDANAPPLHPAVVVATGGIACGEAPRPDDAQRRCRYDLVGELVTSMAPDRFLAIGDIQHSLGGPPDYAAYYGQAFGSLKPVTSPTPGDVDWSPDPAAYLSYFAGAAGPPHGYYSFDLGTWHIISLNSRDCFDADGCDPSSPQFNWLRVDLASHPNDLYPCTLAFFSNPRFMWVDWWQENGRPLGPDPRVTALWSLLDASGVDVVVNGAAHNYERWAPQNLEGDLDPNGITEFVVGTGGKRLIPFGPEPRPPHLMAAQDDAYGALRLELDATGLAYAWRSAAEQPTFHDDGTVACH